MKVAVLKKPAVLVAIIVLLICAALAFPLRPYTFTVVPIQEVEELKQSEAFDPVAWVDGTWASKLLPTIVERAVDLPVILNEMRPDASGTTPKDSLVEIAQEYGLTTAGEAHVYMVKGRGQVVSLDTSSSAGTLELRLEGYNGPITTKLYVGTRIPADETSVRDAVGFITFGDFREQTEFGKVGSEINRRVLREVLAPLDKDTLQGKTIAFYGAFTIRTFNLISINLSEIKIVPVQVEIVE